MPAISVLLPVYNGLPYIQEAVESVLSQDIADWELLISDNGSTDGTKNYLANLDDPRIRVVIQEKNLGIFGNLNFLFETAHAPLCKVICADDTMFPAALRTHLDFFAAHPSVGVVRCWETGDQETYGPNGRGFVQGRLPRVLKPAAAQLAFVTFGNLLGNLSTAACRREVVLAAGGFDQSLPYAGDYEGWARICRATCLGHLPEELVFVREHALQQSNLLNKRNELARESDAILLDLQSRLPADLRGLVRWHWSYHFISPRWSGSFRLLRAGHLSDALKIWFRRPRPGYGPLRTLLLHLPWRLRSPLGEMSTRRLFARIEADNANVS